MPAFNTTSGVNPWKVPAARPPPGITPNFENPHTLKGTTIGVVTTMLTISTLLVLYSSVNRWKKMRLHDYTVLAAMLLMYGFAGLICALLPWALHQWDIQLARLTLTWGKILLASEYFLSPTILIAKVAILLMYLQVFGPMKAPRIAIYVGILFNLLIYLPNFGIAGALCSPAPGHGWTLQVNVRCGRSTIWGPIQGSLSVLDDIYIFILPIPVLARLNMNRQQKVALIAIFGTALLGIAASVIGLAYRVLLWGQTNVDITWNISVVYICMIVEVNVAIIISIMPVVAGLAKRHFGKDSFIYRWCTYKISILTGAKGATPFEGTEGEPKCGSSHHVEPCERSKAAKEESESPSDSEDKADPIDEWAQIPLVRPIAARFARREILTDLEKA